MANYDENAEIAGKYSLAFIQAAGEVSSVFEKKTREMFEKALGGEVKPEEMYEFGNVVEGYLKIQEEVGDNTMKRGGEASAKTVPIPDDTDLGEAFDVLLEEHNRQFQNSDREYPGGRYLHDIDGRTGRLGVDEAYPLPKSFVQGVYKGLIEEYGPSDAMPAFEEAEPEGDERFAWDVTW
ncbi:hypothetical protein [Halorussus lipolyticus]|uniref:hypothetical protein n=1 Tax=Halorussus lipolyticus TaxID=3034024 RepID=UPI0023E81E07|nr:hypothetical protein [Halorussus sp. DT80]